MASRTLEYMLVDDLDKVRHPANSKGHDAAGIRASVARFGFVEPIVVDERTGLLGSGHGRVDELAAGQRRGDDPPDGIEVDSKGRWRAPVVRGWSSENDAELEAFSVAVNQLTIAGGFDGDALLEQVARIQSTPLKFDGLGFDSDELQVMLEAMQTTDVMPPDPGTWDKAAAVDTSVAFRFGDYSGKVQRHVYDAFLARFETLRSENDAVLLDEVLVAWLALTPA